MLDLPIGRNQIVPEKPKDMVPLEQRATMPPPDHCVSAPPGGWSSPPKVVDARAVADDLSALGAPEPRAAPPKISKAMKSVIAEAAAKAETITPSPPANPAAVLEDESIIDLENPDDFIHEHDDEVQTSEAAEIIGFSHANLWPLMKRGVIPYEKRKNRIWILRSVCETIRDLRKDYGREWVSRFTTGDYGHEKSAPLNFDEGVLRDMIYEARSRAKKLHRSGNSAAAMELIQFADWLKGDEL